MSGNTSLETSEIKQPTKRGLIKKLLGVGAVILGSQMVEPKPTGPDVYNNPDSPTKIETSSKQRPIKSPAIIGTVLQKNPDGTLSPYRGFMVALSKEGHPRPDPREREYFPVAEVATDENGQYVFAGIEPGTYILGPAREAGALEKSQVLEEPAFDARKPTSVTAETNVLPGGIIVIGSNN